MKSPVNFMRISVSLGPELEASLSSISSRNVLMDWGLGVIGGSAPRGHSLSRARGRRGIGNSIFFESWQDEVLTQLLLRPARGSNISRGEFSDALVGPGSDFRNCS